MSLCLMSDARLPAVYLCLVSMSWSTGNSTWVQDVLSCTTAQRARVSSVRVPSAKATPVLNWHWLPMFPIFCASRSLMKLLVAFVSTVIDNTYPSMITRAVMRLPCNLNTPASSGRLLSTLPLCLVLVGASARFSGAEFPTNPAEQGLAAPTLPSEVCWHTASIWNVDEWPEVEKIVWVSW